MLLLLFFALYVYSLPKSLQSNYLRHLEIRSTFDYDFYLLCKLMILGGMWRRILLNSSSVNDNELDVL
jgi:hypothetical protein